MPEARGWIDESAPYLASQPGGAGDAWSAQAAAQGRIGTHRILDAGPRQATSEVRAWLGSETAVLRRRLVLLNDEPVEIADSWYPMAIAEGTPLAELKRIRGGTPAFLADRGFVTRRVEEYVSAPRADSEVEEWLNLPPGDRVLRLVRLSRTADGELFEVSVMAMKPDLPDGQLRQLRYELTLD